MIQQPKPLPPARTLLTALDTHARATMQTAQGEVSLIVAQETPRQSGQLAAAMRPRLSRTATGAALTVGPARGRMHGNITVAELVRLVTKGTGEFREGPGPKARIRAKNPLRRMVLPGGRKVWSVAGQHPQPFVRRIRELGTPRVERSAQRGAADAGLAIRRVL